MASASDSWNNIVLHSSLAKVLPDVYDDKENSATALQIQCWKWHIKQDDQNGCDSDEDNEQKSWWSACAIKRI